jgi:hypothetical protein
MYYLCACVYFLFYFIFQKKIVFPSNPLNNCKSEWLSSGSQLNSPIILGPVQAHPPPASARLEFGVVSFILFSLSEYHHLVSAVPLFFLIE